MVYLLAESTKDILPQLGIGGAIAVLLVSMVLNFMKAYRTVKGGPSEGACSRGLEVLSELIHLRQENQKLREEVHTLTIEGRETRALLRLFREEFSQGERKNLNQGESS